MSAPWADIWSEWLLNVRHAGCAEFKHTIQSLIGTVIDKVLDGVGLQEGMTLADIGTGEGVVAFRAIERVGPSLHVILTDISAPLLQHARGVAAERGISRQCTFIRSGAEDLGGLADASVDGVAMRAALAYVADKAVALREFLRILKPGGRISMAEPILIDDAFEARALRELVAVSPRQGTSSPLELLHRYKSAQFPDTEVGMRSTPMTAFSERDLTRLAVNAGFVDVHMEFHIDMAPIIYPSWETFLGTSPHPLAPSLAAILAERFTADERRDFEAIMRPRIENPGTLSTSRVAYLNARKPSRS